MWAILQPRSLKTEWSVCRNVTHVWGPGTGRGPGVVLTAARMPHFLQNCGISLTRSLPRYKQSLKHNATSFLHLTLPCLSARSSRWERSNCRATGSCSKFPAKLLILGESPGGGASTETARMQAVQCKYENTSPPLNGAASYQYVEILTTAYCNGFQNIVNCFL